MLYSIATTLHQGQRQYRLELKALSAHRAPLSAPGVNLRQTRMVVKANRGNATCVQDGRGFLQTRGGGWSGSTNLFMLVEQLGELRFVEPRHLTMPHV